MDKTLQREFIHRLNKLDEKEYLLSTIAYSTAPTLKGMKPSSLLSFTGGGRNLYGLWQKYKDEISAELGLSFFELREKQEKSLVLFYNSDMLESHISGKENRAFLKSVGYDDHRTLLQTLQLLKLRFESMCPHEIGVFLGIPVRDVSEFIRHKGEKCLFCSYWKVYHNPEHARNLFLRYDRAKIGIMHSVIQAHSFGI